MFSILHLINATQIIKIVYYDLDIFSTPPGVEEDLFSTKRNLDIISLSTETDGVKCFRMPAGGSVIEMISTFIPRSGMFIEHHLPSRFCSHQHDDEGRFCLRGASNPHQ
ncbi:MAG: hypothetical protein WBM78_16250 [Desulfobacterales bacterium]